MSAPIARIGLPGRIRCTGEWSACIACTTASDLSGAGRTGTRLGGTVTDATTPRACPRDTGPSWSLDGSTQYASLPALQPVAPTAFTLDVWFTTSTAQSKLIGLGSSPTGRPSASTGTCASRAAGPRAPACSPAATGR